MKNTGDRIKQAVEESIVVYERVNPYSGSEEYSRVGKRTVRRDGALKFVRVAGSDRQITYAAGVGWVLDETK